MTIYSSTAYSDDAFKKKVETIFKKEWEKIPKPGFEEKPRDAESIAWQFRISPPLPVNWPVVKDLQAVYYGYARGLSFSSLKDGEYVGPAWGKVFVDLHAKKRPRFELITDKIIKTSVIGVRPLKASEIQILKLSPLKLLNEKSSTDRDQKIKSYYCLNLQLGNIPSEASEVHRIFFNWLGCSKN
jgi:hypothetical protein